MAVKCYFRNGKNIAISTMKKQLLFFLLILSLTPAYAQGLQSDIMLHPTDGFTAFTLKKNEFIYCQSPFTLPLPSWAWWGITDNITAEIDLLPLIGGLFQPPHLPVPSVNFRFKLRQQNGAVPGIAFRTMFQHLWTTQNQADADNLRVERQGGNSWFNRFNLSWQVREHLYIHFSAGATYTENLRIENKDTLNYTGRFFKQTVNPDVSLNFDWRFRPWMSAHLTAGYGTTFVYLDNIPRKYQVSYGFRVAPFYKNRFGILRTLRAELVGLYIRLPDAGETMKIPAPIFPYLYWQWTLPVKNQSD